MQLCKPSWPPCPAPSWQTWPSSTICPCTLCPPHPRHHPACRRTPKSTTCPQPTSRAGHGWPQHAGTLRPMTLFTVIARSEEHTSELQSHSDLVCRLLLGKKKSKSASRSRGHALLD